MASSADNSTPNPTVSPPLQHPTPSLVATESLRRSFSSSHASLAPSLVERLDRSAEEMSAGGSDIADEVRKMNQEQKTRSRQNSIQSSHHGDAIPGRAADVRRSRASSQNTSILDSARWGGYSPTGYIGSPTGSIHSRTSQKRNSRPHQASAAGASRLAQVMVEPSQEGRPLDSPLAPSNPDFSTPSRHASQSSFALRYDQIASQIEESLQHVPPSPQKHTQVTDALLQLEGADTATAPTRPRSTDTYQEAQRAFKDFDGVHYNQETDELIEVDEHGNEVRRVSARSSNGGFSLQAASMLRQPQDNRMSNYGAPPPTEGMVYYPAPVPRMLNLPKRLSHMPPSATVAKRRTQILSQYGPDIRASAPWLAESRGDASDVRSQLSGSASQADSQPRGMINERMSVANFNNVPPQLRASVFFDHQTIVQDIRVEHESAVDTLDSILAASATAPVNAFLDHPYAGNVMKSVFAPEKAARRSTNTLATAASGDSRKRELNKRRSSSIGRLFQRSSSNELADTLKQHGSRSSILMDPNNKTSKRKSRVSFGDDLTQTSRPGTPADGLTSRRLSGGLIDQAINAQDDVAVESRPATAMSRDPELTEAEQIEQDFREQDKEEGQAANELDEDPEFVQPATLLAELQVRKAQQKSRNKTAATAFPNGMHSTLLEMDAVEEISRRKRRHQRPTLAWEDPALRVHDTEEVNEDVPLGMLFPSKDGSTTRKTGDLRDWDRPLGLMEKRRLEDNEPLSSRRNRLRGISPNKARAIAIANHKAMQAQLEADEPEDEHAGESLVQRSRRLKTKSALDSAISDVAPTDGERPVSTFTDDIMSQFGGLDVKEKPVDPENETLGQRRARLQREAGDGNGEKAKPRLKSSNSLGDLLAQNPTGFRSTSREHHIAEGTLLHTDQLARAKQKQELLRTNLQASHFDAGKPMVDARPNIIRKPSGTGLLGQQGNAAAANGGFAGGMYNNGSGGLAMQQQPQVSPQMYSMNSGAYFPSPSASSMYNPYASMMMPQQQQSQQQRSGNMMRNSSAYQALTGGHMSSFGLPGMYPQQFGGMQQTQQYGMMPNMPMNMNNMGVVMPGNTDMSNMAFDPNIDPKQRDMIDRWRMAVP